MSEFACAEVETYWKFIAQPLDRIMATLEDRSADDRNWRPPAANTNSLQVLGVHVIGNARENILEFICGRPVGRDRDAEFASVADERNNPRQGWPGHRLELETALRTVTSEQLDAERDTARRGPCTGRELLLLVATHANEHTGHAELTRDLLLAAREGA